MAKFGDKKFLITICDGRYYNYELCFSIIKKGKTNTEELGMYGIKFTNKDWIFQNLRQLRNDLELNFFFYIRLINFNYNINFDLQKTSKNNLEINKIVDKFINLIHNIVKCDFLYYSVGGITTDCKTEICQYLFQKEILSIIGFAEVKIQVI